MADDFNPLALDNQMCFPLYAAARLVVQAYRPHLERLGLTYPQYLVLMVLWEKDGQAVSEIGDRLMLDSGTLTPVLKKLETDGVVRRQRAESDDRVVENWLTAKGRKLRQRAIDIPTQLLCSTTIDIPEVVALKEALGPVIRKLVDYHGK